jgi:hypothetical protein
VPKELVHFHEVGGMDAIVHIMETCLEMPLRQVYERIYRAADDA